jgi:hypothetical protein
MRLERLQAATCGAPFPVHEALVTRLLCAHAPGTAAPPVAGGDARDPTVAHVLATCAGYAYADAATVAMMVARLGLESNACVRVAQTVDAMFVHSTAFLVQSRCGRVVVLCYRGTEATNLGNWLGDTDVDPESITLGGEPVVVHSGFYRNLRSTRWAVLQELRHALEGRSLLDPSRTVEHPLEALYVTGHSLGGAMAVLFALSIAGDAEHRALAERLRAVYTFGQPMALLEPAPALARAAGEAIFRHVIPRDVVPALPPVGWGRFAHVGHEYRYVEHAWRRADSPLAQLQSVREIPRTLLSLVGTHKSRSSARYTLRAHGPHHYIAALRPLGRVTEFGDHE